MKRSFLLLVAAAMFAVFPKTSVAQTDRMEKKALSADTETYTSDKILSEGSSLLEKEVTLVGKVTHVCHSSGKKCFVAGTDEKNTVQVFAGGDIKKFDTELEGKTIKATGTVKEYCISKEKIYKQEAEIKAEMGKEDCMNMEQCEDVMSNVKHMKQWMNDNNKDYYPIYYINATIFEVIK